jgi:transcriptional repressor OPI1
MEVDVSSNSALSVSAASPDQFTEGRASSVSLDDPDVRLAAEALGDLRAGMECLIFSKHSRLCVKVH